MQTGLEVEVSQENRDIAVEIAERVDMVPEDERTYTKTESDRLARFVLYSHHRMKAMRQFAETNNLDLPFSL